MRTKCYSELRHLQTFELRFDYLNLEGVVAQTTFGHHRWINQQFYRSYQWKQVRDEVIRRDNGWDLGIPGFVIHEGLLVHHMNPMTPQDIVDGEDWILDPEFLITTSKDTHNAIHYGDESQVRQAPVVRERGDTDLWTPISQRRT
jgi:hypothetical protein